MSYGTVQAEKVTTESGYSLGAGNASSFKNRIINPGMVIDQRNAGASVTPSADSTYTLDRWICRLSQASKFAVQQTTTAPSNFVNSLRVTSTSAYTIGANDFFSVGQRIEGFNVADLGFGTSSAKPITLTFWVYSSLTGTFSGGLSNSGYGRNFAFTYTVNSANTWEQKTVNIVGDTSGTWQTGNGIGLIVQFSLGAGDNYSDTSPNGWSNSNPAIRNTVSVVSTNGATWFVTGVQFEVGTVATSFDFRSYGTELALCQRYAYLIRGNSTFANNFARYIGFGNGTNQFLFFPQYPVQMRTPPTLISSNFAGANLDLYNYSTSTGSALNSIALGEGDVWHGQVTFFCTSGGSIVSGNICSWRWNGNPNAYIGFDAEL